MLSSARVITAGRDIKNRGSFSRMGRKTQADMIAINSEIGRVPPRARCRRYSSEPHDVASRYTASSNAKEYIVVRSTGVNARVQTTSIAMEMKPVAKRMEAISGERPADRRRQAPRPSLPGKGRGLCLQVSR